LAELIQSSAIEEFLPTTTDAFNGELGIHHSGREGLNKPLVKPLVLVFFCWWSVWIVASLSQFA
jgi:hypothetical protein